MLVAQVFKTLLLDLQLVEVLALVLTQVLMGLAAGVACGGGCRGRRRRRMLALWVLMLMRNRGGTRPRRSMLVVVWGGRGTKGTAASVGSVGCTVIYVSCIEGVSLVAALMA